LQSTGAVGRYDLTIEPQRNRVDVSVLSKHSWSRD